MADGGIASTQSPFRRCIWTDHSVVDTDNVSYRVTAMKAGANGNFTPDTGSGVGLDPAGGCHRAMPVAAWRPISTVAR